MDKVIHSLMFCTFLQLRNLTRHKMEEELDAKYHNKFRQT